MSITRRLFLRNTAAVAAVAATTTSPVIADAALPAPSFQDLTRYYAFIWNEFHALSKEMRVDICDSFTAHRNGDIDALKALEGAPSSRALTVLKAAGADRETLPSGGSLTRSQTVSAHEQALWHIAELKRLMTEDGGRRPTIIIQAEYGPHDYCLMGIDIFGRTMDGDGMFRGGPRNG